MNKKNILFGVALLALIIAATLYILGREFSFSALFSALRAADLRFVALGLFCMLVFLFGEGFNTRRALLLCGYRTRPLQLARYAAAGFFYSSITPSASGGQPAQLVYMKKDGIRLSGGSFSLLLVLLSFQTAAIFWGIVGLVNFIATQGALAAEGGWIWLFLLGACINVVEVILLVGMMFSPQFSAFAARVICFVSEKMLRKENGRQRALRAMAEYRGAARLFRKRPLFFPKMVALSLLEMTAFHSIPYFAFRALGYTALSWWRATCMQGMLFISVSSLPLPGAAGVTEGGFALLFSPFLGEMHAGSAMLLSRTISFAFPLLFCGLCLLTCRAASLWRTGKASK